MSETEHEQPEGEPDHGTETHEDTDTEGEPEQSPEEAAATDGSAELMAKADRENARYHRAIEKLFGPDENRHECPTCSGLGIVWGDVGEAAGPPLELLQGEDARPCEKCNAYGVVVTGSKHPGQETKPCTRCGGRGWYEQPVAVAPLATLPTPTGGNPEPLAGNWVPGRGFIPYGSSEPLPGTGGS
jgi:hypothetical protein